MYVLTDASPVFCTINIERVEEKISFAAPTTSRGLEPGSMSPRMRLPFRNFLVAYSAFGPLLLCKIQKSHSHMDMRSPLHIWFKKRCEACGLKERAWHQSLSG